MCSALIQATIIDHLNYCRMTPVPIPYRPHSTHAGIPDVPRTHQPCSCLSAFFFSIFFAWHVFFFRYFQGPSFIFFRRSLIKYWFSPKENHLLPLFKFESPSLFPSITYHYLTWSVFNQFIILLYCQSPHRTPVHVSSRGGNSLLFYMVSSLPREWSSIEYILK